MSVAIGLCEKCHILVKTAPILVERSRALDHAKSYKNLWCIQKFTGSRIRFRVGRGQTKVGTPATFKIIG